MFLFIYEGDNDIAGGEKPAAIAKEARQLIQRIKKDLPQTRIILNSAKPSVARWNFREQYLDLNKRLQKLAMEEGIEIADVWSAMVDEKGEVYTDIFIEDNLHMNKKGYDIWGTVMREYL
ncbi:MAG: GDSL-type esterase/lipase family protein [Owenweeksia sp.]